MRMMPIATPHMHEIPDDKGDALEWRRSLILRGQRDHQFREDEWKKCSEDILYYINAYCWTYDPRTEGPVPFFTYEFQNKALLRLVKAVIYNQDIAMPKSRDMGASWMGLMVFEWFWHFYSDLSFLMVSRTADYVDKRGNPKALFWKIDFLHKFQPHWLLPPGRELGDADPLRKTASLKNKHNGSTIDGEATTDDIARGDRRKAIFIDEFAAFDYEMGFEVLSATRDATGCRIFNSTPKGANNAFYEVVHNTGTESLRLHWTDHPVKAQGLYTTGGDGKVKLLDDFRGFVRFRRKNEEERDVLFPEDYPFTLDGKIRSPWYDYERTRCASDAEIAQELDIDFRGSDAPFFDNEHIQKLIRSTAMTPVSRGTLEFAKLDMEPKRFTRISTGDIRLWINLVDGYPPAGRRYVVGSDISAGTGASNSVTSVVDRVTGEKVALLKTPHMRPTEFAQISIAIAKFFNKGTMIWDASGPTGKTFTMQVIESGYRNIYYRRKEKRVVSTITNEPGYYLNPSDKESLLEEYRAALADGLMINRSKSGLEECLQFIRTPQGIVEHVGCVSTKDPNSARSAHGDEVIADALCAMLLSRKISKVEEENIEAPVGSLAWRINMKAGQVAGNMNDGSLNYGLGPGWEP